MISWIERNINVKVLRRIKEKRTFVDAIGARRWNTIGYILRYELCKITIKQIIIIIVIERKDIAGRPQIKKTRNF